MNSSLYCVCLCGRTLFLLIFHSLAPPSPTRRYISLSFCIVNSLLWLWIAFLHYDMFTHYQVSYTQHARTHFKGKIAVKPHFHRRRIHTYIWHIHSLIFLLSLSLSIIIMLLFFFHLLFVICFFFLSCCVVAFELLFISTNPNGYNRFFLFDILKIENGNSMEMLKSK